MMLFDTIIDRIVAHCHNILATFDMKDAKYIFLVGGFANSKYFQMVMQEEFAKYKVSIEMPALPGLCVVDGAARYGLSSKFVKVRKMPRTYGCAISLKRAELNLKDYPNQFVRDNSKEYDGVKYLRSCFNTFARKGQEVRLDAKPVVQSLAKASKIATEVAITIYSSTEMSPLTVFDDGCSKLGEVRMPIAKDQQDLKVEFSFSNTLITVFAYPTGKEDEKVQCQVKYL